MRTLTLPIGTTWKQARHTAGKIIAENPHINSVRIVVEKETNRMRIEFTVFPQKTVDKLVNL
jgi:hypothetical protein